MDTILIAIFPFLMVATNVASWLVILGGVASAIWRVIHIIWRLKSWNKEKVSEEHRPVNINKTRYAQTEKARLT